MLFFQTFYSWLSFTWTWRQTTGSKNMTQSSISSPNFIFLAVFNPFDTLRFGKIRLFEWPNRGMLIRATRYHEFTLRDQVLKCGSAVQHWAFNGTRFGFSACHQVATTLCGKVTFTLKFSKNYLKSVTLTVTCVRVFPDWDLIWVQKEGKYGPLW